MLSRFHRIGVWDQLHEEWRTWERWFADLEESHTSIAALAFYRSPQPDHSWIVAAGTVLDAASLLRSLVDVPRDPQADLAIRAGYVAPAADLGLLPDPIRSASPGDRSDAP